MESARSAFHAQLAAVMDSLLAAAVCEIAKIFESSLCKHQAELTLKAEEISALRCKLEKVERRQKIKAGWSEEKDAPLGEREGNFSQQTPTTSDTEERLTQSLSKLKKEEVDLDGAVLKRECVVLESKLGSVAIQAPDVEQTLIDVLPATQPKSKRWKSSSVDDSDWDQSSCKTDHTPPQDQASIPFLSISDSGRCSPRPDLSVAQPEEWVPGQSATSNGVLVQENLLAGGVGCSTLASTAVTALSSFQSGYQSDDNSKDDNKLNFLDQQSEKQNSGRSAVQHHAVQREDNPQVPSFESSWQNREDGGTTAPYNRSWRVTSSGSRDSLHSQTNFGHLPAQSEGNARPYTCPYCTKCFAYPSHQRRHLLRHTGVRLHPCQFCDKSFLTPSELTVHTRTHTGERPFACGQCGKRFARSGNLRAHQRDVHMGKRPFACEECGKKFAHRGNLRVHNHRVHQGDPYYIDEQPESEMGSSPI